MLETTAKKKTKKSKIGIKNIDNKDKLKESRTIKEITTCMTPVIRYSSNSFVVVP